MSEEHFDKFLSLALKSSAISEVEFDTPLDEVEQKILKKLKKYQAKRKRRQRLILQAAVLMIALTGAAGCLLFPQSAYALKQRVVETITNWSKTIQLNFSGYSFNSNFFNKMEEDIAAIQPEIPFKIMIPKRIPDGIEYQGAENYSSNQQPKICMSFTNQDSLFTLTQAKIPNNRNLTVNIGANKGTVEIVRVGRYEGYLITYKDGRCELIWFSEENIECTIYGDVKPDQAVEMANSLQ